MVDPTAVSAPMSAEAQKDLILEIEGLKTHFPTPNGVAKVLDGLDLHVGRGEIVGLVGESGSGKSVTGFSIVRLLKRPGKIVEGSVKFDGTAADAIDRLEVAGIANARLRDLAGLVEHEQLTARHRWREVDSPVGPVKALLPPATLDGDEPVMGPIPAPGQHTEQILAELGLSSADLSTTEEDS